MTIELIFLRTIYSSNQTIHFKIIFLLQMPQVPTDHFLDYVTPDLMENYKWSEQPKKRLGRVQEKWESQQQSSPVYSQNKRLNNSPTHLKPSGSTGIQMVSQLNSKEGSEYPLKPKSPVKVNSFTFLFILSLQRIF